MAPSTKSLFSLLKTQVRIFDVVWYWIMGVESRGLGVRNQIVDDSNPGFFKIGPRLNVDSDSDEDFD